MAFPSFIFSIVYRVSISCSLIVYASFEVSGPVFYNLVAPQYPNLTSSPLLFSWL